MWGMYRLTKAYDAKPENKAKRRAYDAKPGAKAKRKAHDAKRGK
jgi:hypothetical protein